MKKRIFFFFAFIAIFCQFDEKIELGNQAYRQSNFNDALKYYQSIEEKNWALWYNMGNCWFYLENYPKALVCWKRALKGGGKVYRDRIEHNCKCVERRLELEEADKKSLTTYGGRVPLLLWQLIFLILLYTTAFYSQKLLTEKNYVKFIGLLLMLIFFGIIIATHYKNSVRRFAVICQSVDLMAGTNRNFTKKGPVKAGQEVEVTDSKEEWYKITVTNQQGWVLSENVELL